MTLKNTIIDKAVTDAVTAKKDELKNEISKRREVEAFRIRTGTNEPFDNLNWSDMNRFHDRGTLPAHLEDEAFRARYDLLESELKHAASAIDTTERESRMQAALSIPLRVEEISRLEVEREAFLQRHAVDSPDGLIGYQKKEFKELLEAQNARLAELTTE